MSSFVPSRALLELPQQRSPAARCYRAHIFRPLFLPSPSFHPLRFHDPIIILIPPTNPFHSLSFLSPFFFFHTSQEQDKMAHGLHSTIQYVIALTFFALFSLSESLLSPLRFHDLILILIPQQTRSFIPLYFPLFTRVKNRQNGPQPSFNDSVLVHAYWYCYC